MKLTKRTYKEHYGCCFYKPQIARQKKRKVSKGKIKKKGDKRIKIKIKNRSRKIMSGLRITLREAPPLFVP